MRIVLTLSVILLSTGVSMAQAKKTKAQKQDTQKTTQPAPVAPAKQEPVTPMSGPQAVMKKDVPPAVISSYISQNSEGVTDSVWTREYITIYKVSYIDNDQRYEAQYFSDGRWIKTYTELYLLALPSSVISKIGELFPGHKIDKAYVELNNDGKFYSCDLINDNNKSDKKTVYFTMGGKFVK